MFTWPKSPRKCEKCESLIDSIDFYEKSYYCDHCDRMYDVCSEDYVKPLKEFSKRKTPDGND